MVLGIARPSIVAGILAGKGEGEYAAHHMVPSWTKLSHMQLYNNAWLLTFAS